MFSTLLNKTFPSFLRYFVMYRSCFLIFVHMFGRDGDYQLIRCLTGYMYNKKNNNNNNNNNDDDDDDDNDDNDNNNNNHNNKHDEKSWEWEPGFDSRTVIGNSQKKTLKYRKYVSRDFCFGGKIENGRRVGQTTFLNDVFLVIWRVTCLSER